jgi:hypothetical protein
MISRLTENKINQLKQDLNKWIRFDYTPATVVSKTDVPRRYSWRIRGSKKGSLYIYLTDADVVEDNVIQLYADQAIMVLSANYFGSDKPKNQVSSEPTDYIVDQFFNYKVTNPNRIMRPMIRGEFE